MSEIDWDEFSRVFDRFNQPKYNIILPMFCQWIVDRLDERGGDDPARFVEIGCGTGLISERLVEGYPDSEFLLNDNNPAMLRIAAERFESSEAVVDLEESEGEVFLSGLETDSIEVAIFARSFYAMSDHAAVARETLRALEPGGRVILLDFTGPAAIEPLDAIFGKEEPE
ncbi:MAG: hypothetical protein CL908_20695, partial [Deltaproteobacteria bacterium]|nr:hypothetical protein [Deltaproteobacteria bacterium]